MTVLILAQDFDRTADHVVRALHERDVPVVRVDLSWFPQRLSIEAELTCGGWVGRLRTEHRELSLEAIRSIWYLSSPDGSWCEVSADAEGGVRRVQEAGPRRLWKIVEEVHDRWVQLGKPGWEHFGYSVTRHTQWTWFDEPRNPI
jgi:hypothetical protein